jgi:hypothetical protein
MTCKLIILFYPVIKYCVDHENMFILYLEVDPNDYSVSGK